MFRESSDIQSRSVMTAWPESSKVWSYSIKSKRHSVFTALDMTWSVYPEPTNFVTFCQQTDLCTLTHSAGTNIRGGAFIATNCQPRSHYLILVVYRYSMYVNQNQPQEENLTLPQQKQRQHTFTSKHYHPLSLDKTPLSLDFL